MYDFIFPLLGTVITAFIGFAGVQLKNWYTQHIDTKEKKDIVETVVKAVEQMYKDMHGEEKLKQALSSAEELLTSKGITFTDFEVKMLIEKTLAELNEVWRNGNLQNDNSGKE
jgi:hypothetical protein